MSQARPLMPKATAMWLVDNTKLTFRQIAQFTQLHELEVQALADGEVMMITPLDPTANSQLDAEEIVRCEADPAANLVLKTSNLPKPKPRMKGPRYTPVAKRGDKPNGIMWLVKNHPELSYGQISKLVGTTKPTIEKIKDRSHWNIQNIKAQDPVELGLCSLVELQDAVKKARIRNPELVVQQPEMLEDGDAGSDYDSDTAA